MIHFSLPLLVPLDHDHETDRPKKPKRVKYIRTLDQISNIPPHESEKLEKVTQPYVFRANDYYLKLINWEDPADPIKQLIIPREEELNDWGKLDASNELAYTVAHDWRVPK